MLTYQQAHGESELAILNQCYLQRKPLPDFIKDAPELHLDNVIYYKAFTDLSSCRINTFAVAPIPWTALHTYASEYLELSDTELTDFISVVTRVDNNYLSVVNTKDK